MGGIQQDRRAGQARHPGKRAAGTHVYMYICSMPYRLVIADGVDLGPEHDSREGEEEEALKAQEDEQDDGDRWGEVAAL